MYLKIGNKETDIEISNDVIKEILNFYSDEHLVDHYKNVIFPKELYITIDKLKKISNQINVAWQMFLLNEENLAHELKEIDQKRKDKFPIETSYSSRGNSPSFRILDRLIRIQSYIKSNFTEDHQFVGSLKSSDISNSAEIIKKTREFFEIEMDIFRDKKIDKALNYLKEKIEFKNINISKRVAVHSILPTIKPCRNAYKQSSGFVILDQKIPFIFLPNDTDDTDGAEPPARQIFTCIFLLFIIGFEAKFRIFARSDIEESFSNQPVSSEVSPHYIYELTSEFLLPKEITRKMEEEEINQDYINEIKDKYNLSYSAVLFILRIREIISNDTYKSLELNGSISPSQRNARLPHLSTAVENFCGSVAFKKIQSDYQNRKISKPQVHTMIFGRVNKKKNINEILDLQDN